MRIRIVLFLSLVYFSSFSQGGSNSVYSQYGFGMLYPHQSGQSFGMGNTGIAMNNPLGINLFNPASVADIKYMTFDVNALSNSIIAKDGINTPASYTDGSLGTIALAVPLLKNWGAYAGLTPFSSVGYRVLRTFSDSTLGTVNDYYHGTGGVNSIFLGSGYRYKNLSVGAKGNYLFGAFTHEQLRVLTPGTFFNSYIQNKYTFANITLDFGAQYRIAANENLSFIVGVVYGMQQELSVKTTERMVTTTQNVLTDSSATAVYVKSVVFDNTANPGKATLTYPQYFGGGISMNYKERLIITFDYKQQEWKKFELTNSSSYTEGKSFNFGAEWTPNKNSAGNENYHKRVAYRMGLRYANLPLTISNTNITDYGFNIGVAFPLRKLKFERELFGSYINVGFEAGRRGTLAAGLVEENYYKINIGFTFNDKWFIKRKFD
jgi:hypothetical protein